MAQDSAALVPISTVEIGTRIAEIADAVGGNSALAKICDVAEGTVRNWRTGPSEPAASNLVAVARAGNVTVEWLATGKEPKDPALVMSAEGYLQVPFYDTRLVSVGNDLFDAEPATQSIMVPASWPAESVGTSSSSLAFVRMGGDSMKPTLRDGDLLLIDRNDQVVSNSVYVFFWSGVIFIQRLQQTLNGVVFFQEGDLEPSKMPDFVEFEGRNGIVGRVLWSGRKL